MGETRQEIVKRLCWDYDIDPADLLDVVEGYRESAGPLDRQKLFARSLERLPWNRIVELWGFEQARSLLGPGTISLVRDKSRRKQLERLEKILRGESVSASRWDSELRKKLQNSVLSNRWYRTKQGIL